MSSLVKQDNFAPVLTREQKELVLYSNGYRISTVDKNGLKEHFYNYIEKAIFNCGQVNNFTEEHLVVLTKDLIDLCKIKFVSLTIREVGRALHRGSIGTYGDFFGVNLKTLRSWIISYKIERDTAKLLQSNHDIEMSDTKTEPTNEQKAEIRKEFLIYSYDKPLDVYKKRGVWTFKNTAHLFKILEEENKITLSKEQKLNYIPKAKEEYVNRLKLPVLTMDEKRKNSRMLKEYNLGRYDMEVIKTIAKELAFKDYVIKLIEIENDI